MISKWLFTTTLFSIFILSLSGTASSSFEIQAKEAVHLEIRGYEGLAETTLFQGELTAGARQSISSAYRGLALLLFEHGQAYPIILGEQSFTLTVSSSDTLPAFTGSAENRYFYAILSGTGTKNSQYGFADLMIEAKLLLDSTDYIRTIDELQSMKEKFHDFVRSHSTDLYHSDMLRRLLAQYFMMHEYVDYHVPGAPATDIQVRYQKAIMDGVRNWLDILNADIPRHEVLNYCVSLYFDRSMVALAYQIMENFREDAYCPGKEKKTPAFPPSLGLIDADNNQRSMREITGKKLIAFVSDDCPVSKAATVIKARQLAGQRDTRLIVMPLQSLSQNHLSMQRMVSGGNLLFVNDAKWREENISQEMKLPMFIWIEEQYCRHHEADHRQYQYGGCSSCRNIFNHQRNYSAWR